MIRVKLGLASLGVAFVAGVALIPTTAGHAASQTMDLAVDRHAYVPDGGGPDAYQANALSGGNANGPDPTDIHVGATPSQSTYHSLIHVELSSVDATYPGATVSSLVVTLYLSENAQNNVYSAATTVMLAAYPLKTELPASFSGCPPTGATCTFPLPDLTVAPVQGVIHQNDATTCPYARPVSSTDPTLQPCWTFDLGPMLSYWSNRNDNTGAAIVGDTKNTASPWTIGFTRSLLHASANVNVPPPSPSPSVKAPVAPAHPTQPRSGGGSRPVTPAVASPAATPKPSPSAAPTVTGTVVVPPSGGGQIPIWLMVLGVSLAAAVALLAQPVSQALSGTNGLRFGLLHELKLHPRMAAVAGGLLVWSSAWGAYSGVTGAGNAGGSTLASLPGGASSNIPGYSPNAAGTPGGAPAPGSSGSGGGGGGGSIQGAPVGAAAFASSSAAAVPSANYYQGADNTVGITNTSIQMCAHAALTFGPAFNIGAADLNVFWQMVNDPSADPAEYPHTAGQAGIYNRNILQPDGTPGISVQDDGYQPNKAVTAATACQQQQGGDFFLLSGIGFDQIPNVRVWAEQNKMLYIHHIATEQNTGGLQYSFTMLPTLEQVGTQFGQYYLTHLSGKKIGIIERNSSNWSPGIRTFKGALAQGGQAGNIGPDDSVANNQGDYSKEVADMCNPLKPMDAVFIWENALAADSIIQQASNQNCNPKWLLFPFNLTLQTLQGGGVDTTGMQGIVPWPAYTCATQRPGNFFGGNAAYQNEVAQFEKAYQTYDKAANLCGLGGDLLFGAWEAWKQVAQLLVDCGSTCTRNNIAGLMLNGYKATVGSNCPVDFSGGDHHHGGAGEDLYATAGSKGSQYWINNPNFCQVTIS